jgi:hypothetical protein
VLESGPTARETTLVRLACALLVLSAGLCEAHDADIIYALVKPGGGPGVLDETLTLTGPTLGLLAPMDADGDGALSQADLDAKTRALEIGIWDELPLTAGGQPCARTATRAVLREGFVELDARFDCRSGALHQDFRILRVLPANYRVVLGSQFDGEGGSRGFAQGSLTAISIPRPAEPGQWDAGRFQDGFAEGAHRGLSLEAMGALAALLLALGHWRRGLLALGLTLGVTAIASALPGQWLGPSAVLVLVATGAAASQKPPLVLAAILGMAMGSRGGGGVWPSVLGLALGSVAVLAVTGPVIIAVSVVVVRRPRLLRVARWVPWVCVLVGVGLGATRLSW